MTNAEKYLKEEQFIFDIAKGISEAICYDDMEHLKKITEKEIRNWFTSETNPILTGDERVILRNVDKRYKYIGRTDYDARVQYLYLNVEDGWKPHTMEEFSNLFKFIKERRGI